MKLALKAIAVLTLLGVYLAFGWGIGLLVLLVTLLAWAIRLGRIGAALAPFCSCPSCAFEVPTYGLFRCGTCGAVTEGSAWRCAFCDAHYSFLPCPRCGVAVPNPEGVEP